MTFALPAWLVAAGLAALAGGLYVLQRLRVRHREVVVPTTMFWRAAVEETRARVLKKRFRHPLAYALLLAIASLLWLAVAEPSAASQAEERRTIFLLDGSAGMAWGDRFERAKETLMDQLGRFPDGGAEVYFCGGWPRTLLRRGEHAILLERRLARVRPEACPCSLERTVAALPADEPATIVVIGDGPLRDGAVPETFTVLRPGRAGERPANAGVLALGVSEAASGAWDRVDVHVEASGSYRVDLESLADVPADGREVVVRVAGNDAIALDDTARIVLPRRAKLRVRAEPELLSVLRADPGVEIADDGLSIAVADGRAIVVEGPPESRATAPLDAVEFVGAERGAAPVVVEWRDAPARAVSIGRELLTERYHFARTRAFPLFVARSLRWLARERPFPEYVAAGEPVPGSDFVPPVAGSYENGIAALLDPLPRSDAPRDDGLDRAGGAGDAALWLALAAFALLMAEWFLHRTGRVP